VSVAVTVGRGIGQHLALRANVAFRIVLIDKILRPQHPRLGWREAAIVGDAWNPPVLKPFGDADRGSGDDDFLDFFGVLMPRLSCPVAALLSAW
jgi:hypothetical protein